MHCNRHGELSSDQIRSYIRNRRGSSKLVHGCKLCHRMSAGSSKKKAREDYRNGITDVEPIENIRTREDRKKNPEKYRKWSKNSREKQGTFRNVVEICRVRSISTNEYQSILKSQNYKCAICKQSETRKNRAGEIARLCLDHNHKTNKIREFLCHNCNVMIGKFHESIEFIESAINYLIIHGDVCRK
jgi:hypothetical protein